MDDEAPHPPATREILTRLTGLTDGVFAIALTLMVLEIRIPAHEDIVSEGQLLGALADLAPRFLSYLVSFLTLTIFWFGQQSQHRLLAGADRRLATLHLSFLAAVSLLPFSTDFLAEFVAFRTSILVYWANLVLLGLLLALGWRYAERHGFVVPGTEVSAVYRRIFRAQAFWAAGMVLGLISVPLGLVVFLLAQLVYAASPEAKWIRTIIG